MDTVKTEMLSELKEEKILWSNLFNLNQFAFAVWNCFSIYQVLLLCSVSSLWKNRIWQFEDCPRKRHVKRKQIIKDLRGMKFTQVRAFLKCILSNSFKDPTSSKTQYFFGLKSIAFVKKAPLYSRLRILCSLATHLREIHLYSIKCTSPENSTLKIIAYHAKGIEILQLIECGIDSRVFPTLSRFKKLKRFVLEDSGSCLMHFRIEARDLYLFYLACPDLTQVNLSSNCCNFYGQNFCTICPLNLSAFSFDMKMDQVKEMSQPHCNLLYLNMDVDLLRLSWMNVVNFPSLTSLSLGFDDSWFNPRSLAQLCDFLSLKALKLFMQYDATCGSQVNQYLSEFGRLKNLELLAFVEVLHKKKSVVTQILQSGILSSLKHLIVLPDLDDDNWRWSGGLEIDLVLAPLLNVDCKLTALCVDSVKEKYPSSKVIQRFQSVVYGDTPSNIQRKCSLFL